MQNSETVMTFKALTGLGPGYLEQLLIECNNVSTASEVTILNWHSQNLGLIF